MVVSPALDWLDRHIEDPYFSENQVRDGTRSFVLKVEATANSESRIEAGTINSDGYDQLSLNSELARVALNGPYEPSERSMPCLINSLTGL